jgi:hypothetical protein
MKIDFVVHLFVKDVLYTTIDYTQAKVINLAILNSIMKGSDGVCQS